jgi:nicotinamidase/pyrazinamidase
MAWGGAAWDPPETAIIVVDVQGDFTIWKKGSLAVPGTDRAFVNRVRRATEGLSKAGYPIYGTQDWHPADHVSFFTNHPGRKAFDVVRIKDRDQVLWPPHCVQGTQNARILMDKRLFAAIVRKGQDRAWDSYSGFQDDGGRRTELDPILKTRGVRKLIVYGIAADYCVKATALDAVAARYEVMVVDDLCRGVAADTTAQAREEMKARGVVIVPTLDFAAGTLP